ncbi:50S ribosomal protein L28 [Candidatus Beckwithbacteria bacterium]|nr:50S ribosomal protein L28 [Candidatus Beckwithbacteria bacterium]
MAKYCQNCGKGVMMGNKVTRARQELLYRSPKVYKPNLHTMKVNRGDGTSFRMTFCTKCLRMMKQFMAENQTKAIKIEKAE